MNNQKHLPDIQESIQFEIVDQDGDIANIEEVSRILVNELRSEGYSVEPDSEIGIKGNPLYDIIIHGYRLIHGNGDLLAALFSFLAGVLTVIDKLRKHDKIPDPVSIEITFTTVDNKPITIKASDTESTIKLLNHLKDQPPKEIIAASKSANLHLHVSRKKRRRK